MKTLLFLFTFMLFAQHIDAQTTGSTGKVYISTNALAKKYHKTKSCFSLKNDQNTLKTVSLSEAKKLGRTPCKNCYSEKVSNPGTVFVCTGGSSKKYHGASDCTGLKSCHGSIVKMAVAKAKEAGRTACKLCIQQN